MSSSVAPSGTREPMFSDPRGVAEQKAREAARIAEANPARAFQLFEQAADYGHPGAAFEAGAFLEHGIRNALEPDEDEAAYNYVVASIGGVASARFNLAFMYERGAGGLRRSSDRALQLFDAAAEMGHAGAASAIAERLFRGVVRDKTEQSGGGVPEQFFEESIYYWCMAARAGSPQACASLAVIFAEGLGVKPDVELGDRLLELAVLLWWRGVREGLGSNAPAQTPPTQQTTGGEGGGAPRAQSPGGGVHRGPPPPNEGGDGRPRSREGKKKKVHLLRLPVYFNKAGPAALVKDRDLTRKWDRGPRTLEECLEKYMTKRGREFEFQVPGRREKGAALPLSGDGAMPVSAMLEFLRNLQVLDLSSASMEAAMAILGGRGGNCSSSKKKGSRTGKDGRPQSQGSDDEDGPSSKKQSAVGKALGIGSGPVIAFTFRHPDVSLQLFKEFKRLSGHRARRRSALEAGGGGRGRGDCWRRRRRGRRRGAAVPTAAAATTLPVSVGAAATATALRPAEKEPPRMRGRLVVVVVVAAAARAAKRRSGSGRRPWRGAGQSRPRSRSGWEQSRRRLARRAPAAMASRGGERCGSSRCSRCRGTKCRRRGARRAPRKQTGTAARRASPSSRTRRARAWAAPRRSLPRAAFPSAARMAASAAATAATAEIPRRWVPMALAAAGPSGRSRLHHRPEAAVAVAVAGAAGTAKPTAVTCEVWSCNRARQALP